jgi:hypothetical protein
VRRWTLFVLIGLFIALAAVAGLQFALGQKDELCPGPKAPFGGPNDIVRCEQGTPIPSP